MLACACVWEGVRACLCNPLVTFSSQMSRSIFPCMSKTETRASSRVGLSLDHATNRNLGENCSSRSKMLGAVVFRQPAPDRMHG